MSSDPRTPDADVACPLLWGGVGLLALVGICGGWAATTVISGAVVSTGQVGVPGESKTVQSLDGGILSELSVKNGDHVQAGQVLARLDPTLLQMNLDISEGRLAADMALRERLRAESRGAESLTFDYPDLPAALAGLTLTTGPAETAQHAIFDARTQMRRGGRARLAEQQHQIDNQIKGVEGQLGALRDQLALLDDDLATTRDLVARDLVRQSRLSDLQSRHATLLGDISAREADLARLGNARHEATLETLQSERQMAENVALELREVTARIEELQMEIVTRTAQLDRVALRAPSSGIVHEVQITTLGGVVAPGGTIMDIVPQGAGFDFELKIDPVSADQVHPGQGARVVLSSFDRQSTPELAATVTSISPGAVLDPRTGQSFYRVALDVLPGELARLGPDVTLIPGMPVEGYLQTGERTVLAYLLQPVTGHLRRAFRE